MPKIPKIPIENQFIYLMCLIILFGLVQQYQDGYFHRPLPSKAAIKDAQAGNLAIRIFRQMDLARNMERLELERHLLLYGRVE